MLNFFMSAIYRVGVKQFSNDDVVSIISITVKLYAFKLTLFNISGIYNFMWNHA